MLYHHIVLLVAVVITAVAAVIDWKTEKIPNWLTLTPLALAPFVHAVNAGLTSGVRGAAGAFGLSLLGAVVCGLAPLVLYVVGGAGGGDLKLLAALGALLTPVTLGLETEFYSFLAAALYAPARLAYEGKLLRTLGNTLSLVINPFLPKARRRTMTPELMTWLRFGPAIFVGTCAAAFLNWSIQ